MTKLKDVFEYLCSLAPLETQMDFDNSGFLMGRREQSLQRVMLALDITDEVIDEALFRKVQLIISHHPLIWNAPKAINDDSAYTSRLLTLAENRISVVSMHTNLDIADGGVNDVLISMFCDNQTRDRIFDCGRIGYIDKPMSMAEFLPLCKEKLNVKGLRYYDSGKPVHCLGVLGGGGSDYIREAFEKGCDTYITADIKYHQFQEAVDLGINLIDGDHFCTENPVMPALCSKLSAEFPEIEFFVSDRHQAIVSFA